jgi:hypothetical protein
MKDELVSLVGTVLRGNTERETSVS